MGVTAGGLIPLPGGTCPPGMMVAGVWDCNDPHGAWWRHGGWEGPAGRWAEKHLGPYHSDTHMAVFVVTDAGPAVVLYRWAENSEGRRYLDPGTGRPAELPPSIMLLPGLPPAGLLTAGGNHGAPDAGAGGADRPALA